MLSAAVPLRLQKNQFLIQKGEGREVLQQTKEVWEKEPSLQTLHCYMATLMETDHAKELLELWETDAVQRLVCEVNADTESLWQMLFWAAVAETDENCFALWLATFREQADEYAVFSAEWMRTELLKKLGRLEEKAESKKLLSEHLETLSVNEYLRMHYKKRLEEL